MSTSWSAVLSREDKLEGLWKTKPKRLFQATERAVIGEGWICQDCDVGGASRV